LHPPRESSYRGSPSLSETWDDVGLQAGGGGGGVYPASVNVRGGV